MGDPGSAEFMAVLVCDERVDITDQALAAVAPLVLSRWRDELRPQEVTSRAVLRRNHNE